MFVRSLVLAGLMCCTKALAQTPVFINELHYDNASTDQNETVEIAGPVGTDLSGWSIVLYNGSGGVVYSTLPLSGAIPASCAGGMGVIHVAAAGLQNGAPDGLALVNSSGTAVQFLSYEGSFAATNGPAAGQQSIDIGASEDASGSATASLGLTGTGDSYEDFAWSTATAATFGACNTGQTFTGGSDTPPTVQSTTPTNGANNAAAFVSPTISFSEPVTVSGTWFEIACSISGSHSVANAVVTSSASRVFTINPNADFASGDQCTVTVFAPQVTDQDGLPDNLATNHSFGFAVAADIPPTVASISPGAGATGVASGANVVVTFSEPVTAPSTSFNLSCGAAAQQFAFAGTGSQFTLNPVANLPHATACTVTITGSAIVEVDSTPNAMQADFSSSFTTGASSGNYYTTADASSAALLRATLHNIIDDHQRFPYTADHGTDTWDILKLADQDPLDPSRILDIYRNTSYLKELGGNSFYNREHTWPNSLGFSIDGPENSAYTDTHMLMLSDIGHNAARGNLPFGPCASGESFPTLFYFGQGGPGHDNLRCGGFWQVWDALRGNVARGILYMDIRFEGGSHDVTGFVEPDLRLTDNVSLITQSGGNASIAYMGLLATLLSWHELDPPDERERLRNDIIQTYQGNRNPFVDHPEWAACLYQSQCSAPTEVIFQNGFE